MARLAMVRGCAFPTDLFYDVANHMWYAPLEGGLVRCGMTVIGPALADQRIYAFTPKRTGRDLEAGKSCATIESSKWVGPARIAFDGTVIAVNERAIEVPSLLVHDAYGTGWMIIARPSAPDALSNLLTGDAIATAYEAWMNANDFPGCDIDDAR